MGQTTRFENMKNRVEYLNGGVPLEGNKTAAILRAFCEELDRLHNRIDDLMKEAASEEDPVGVEQERVT